ncbi:MAG: dihydropteroate synthase [Sedimenticola selenatireducens]|uniref:Dihydropteroate synthase n=2 Tax=Sedimenticola selenatireducens TaxID=191960 RepID=A0A558DKN8_9GAMM|nr:dihydropteroate synthase [Sedimenticola selenatireducens]TVT61573.1 MAG: dihydropteroate synthase [Sedimenticola selenatireducens]
MGILNITPDSFSDGGNFVNPEKALQRALAMVAEGADILDVGGESTRPGAQSVGEQQELDRVIPVIQAIAAELPIPISVDTNKAGVMREAVTAGAGLINDVMALQGEGALEVAKTLGVPVCLMHMQGQPRTMQHAPQYQDVVKDVRAFLVDRIAACVEAGMPRENLLLDPGFGFGKTLAHNLRLLRELRQFEALELPLLVGISRKSMIGAVLDDAAVDQRLFGGLACAVMAVERGAAIIRTHDIKPTADVLRMTHAVMSAT